jgi:prepilin-type N-terminal cleavage/methylation domain-containing protein
MLNLQIKILPRRTSHSGFTLIELLVAMVIFLVISGAAFSLLAQHQPIFNQQQNLAEVNIALRNAVAQMELDIGNAGANFYATANIPNYPVGVVVTNNVVASGGDCRTGTPKVYGANCFDQLSIISADLTTTPMNPSMNPVTAGWDATCVPTHPTNGAVNATVPPTHATDTRTSTLTYLIPPAGSTVAQINALVGKYKNGDQILFVSNDGSQYTTAALTADGLAYPNATAPTYVKLTHGATTSYTDSGTGYIYYGYNTSSPTGNDPYNMTTNENTMIGEGYCSTDWVLRLTPITYKVDLTTPSNPSLLRIVAGQSGQTTATETLATQVIGFKIGASLHNNVNDTDTTTYSFDASNYNNGTAIPYNYTLLRSVMISLVGRTNPNTDPTYVFRNTFDSGPYEIQGVSIVVNPRNMSMAD